MRYIILEGGGGAVRIRKANPFDSIKNLYDADTSVEPWSEGGGAAFALYRFHWTSGIGETGAFRLVYERASWLN